MPRHSRGDGSFAAAVSAMDHLAEAGGGLYWLATGIAFAVTGAIANAWVLLVEILR